MRASRLGAGVRRPVAPIRPRAPSSAPGVSSQASSRSRSYGPGSHRAVGLFAREAEAPIIGCVADQQHRAMLAPPCSRHRAAHQRAADPPGALGFVHRQRPEQHRRPAGAGADVPQADRADDVAIVFGDERKPGRRLAAFAQPLGGFLEARRVPTRGRAGPRAHRYRKAFQCGSSPWPTPFPACPPAAAGGLGGGSLVRAGLMMGAGNSPAPGEFGLARKRDPRCGTSSAARSR